MYTQFKNRHCNDVQYVCIKYKYLMIFCLIGTSLSVIINLNVTIAIVTSAVVALGYTMFGQVISVVYTDVVQLFFITIGLVCENIILYYSAD